MALEQVLHGADLGVVDPLTRQYVTWVWSYGRAPLDSGEALALCLATSYRGSLGESRWTALLTLGQAVAECLPDGDEDRRIILGLLGATVRGRESKPAEGAQSQFEGVRTTDT